MKYGFDLSIVGEYCNPQLLVNLAVEAEQAGWDGVFLWDCVFAANEPSWPVTDPWIVLAAIAARTQRIRIGAMLTPLARRRPWMVARETVALDHLSNGRLIFGAGLGYQSLEFTPFGEEYDPKIRAEKLDEGLAVLSRLWQGEAFRFDGKHHQVDVPNFLPKPIQSPRIPIWIGGYWPNHRPFRRAARWDGVYAGSEKADGEPLTFADFQEMVAYLKAQRVSPVPFDIAVPGITPSDPAQGAEIVQPYIDAGATWWVEAINQWVGPLEEMKERIRSGPPKL
jgi:alkanesulfonate monooxygenase SsuD/methylene tetrahydromethanopterin reductase-like flavin-dependent oxidoreductase (luciferase family)